MVTGESLGMPQKLLQARLGTPGIAKSTYQETPVLVVMALSHPPHLLQLIP